MRATSILTAILLLAGCNNDTREPGSDAGTPDAGNATGTDGGAPACGDPGAPYGTSVGSHFLPFTLPTCGDEPYEFYGEAEGFCDSTFTVVSIAAGWCGPCRQEARLMQEFLVDRYADQNVRVVVAIIQDNDYFTPDATFCQGWVDQYGLTNPVLYDVAQDTQIYFPAGSLPATLIVDSEGVIRHREYGVSTNLETVRGALDELLGL